MMAGLNNLLQVTIDGIDMDKKILISRKLFSKTGETFIDTENIEIEAYKTLFKRGVEICGEYCAGSVDFYFVDSIRKQAVAVHEHNAIMIFKGFLDFMARVASMLAVVATMVSSLPENCSAPWKGNIRSWLQEEDFNWGDEEYWWLANKECRRLFDFYLDNLFTFVMLHEVGHIHHMHDLRRINNQQSTQETKKETTRPAYSSAPDKPLTHEIISESTIQVESYTDRLARHAREVVADTYGFQFLMEEIAKNKNDEVPFFAQEHLEFIEKTFADAILTASSFFWGASMVARDMDENHQENRYPTHAFRLQTIEATALEHGICGLPIQTATEILKRSMNQTAEMLHEASGNTDYILWRLKSQNPIHFEHYRDVCEEVTKWYNIRFRQSDG